MASALWISARSFSACSGSFFAYLIQGTFIVIQGT
jgi:hypothetical protein